MAQPNPPSSGRITTLLSEAGLLSAFALHAVRMCVRRPFELKEIVRQVYLFGWRPLPLVMTSGLAIGVVLSMHTRATMERFGVEALIPAALAIAMMRTGQVWALGISRRGVEANAGQLYVHNLPDFGCRFTIDVPRS